jgi:hypothetical protein
MSAATILSALAPAITEALGLVGDIVAAGGDARKTIARIRSNLPAWLVAAETGATPETEDDWEDHVRNHFGRGGTP